MDRHFAYYVIFIASLGVGTLCRAAKFYRVDYVTNQGSRIVGDGNIDGISGNAGVQIDDRVRIYHSAGQQRSYMDFDDISNVQYSGTCVTFTYSGQSIAINFLNAGEAGAFVIILRNYAQA